MTSYWLAGEMNVAGRRVEIGAYEEVSRRCGQTVGAPLRAGGWFNEGKGSGRNR